MPGKQRSHPYVICREGVPVKHDENPTRTKPLPLAATSVEVASFVMAIHALFPFVADEIRWTLKSA
jgi:hypothetical protein